MAMPLALVFAACSTDDSDRVSGGAEEETGIVATLQVYAYCATSGAVAREAGSSENGSIGFSLPQNLFSEKGKVVLTELDPKTLAPVGDSSLTAEFGSAAGTVQFSDVELKTPVVSLEASSDSVSLKTIVDVREANAFVVDELSHLETYRIKKLVESGLSFASAKAQAETEVANTFGFTDSSMQDLWRKAFNEVVPIDLLNQLGKEFGDAGNAAGISDASKKSLTHVVENSPIMDFLEYPSAVFDVLGESSAEFYQDCLRRKDFYASMLAGVFAAGECSSEKEGVLVDVGGEFREIGCQSGSWTLLYSRARRYYVEHTFGTVVDPRDGRTYKTVTIDLGGKSQTWMAENLNYATDFSFCVANDTSWCATFGREYYFIDALDSMEYRNYTNKEECEAYLPEYFKRAIEVYDSTDVLFATSSYCYDDVEYSIYSAFNVNWEKVIDSLDVLNYDVCPEGWRMSNFEDWNTLLSYLAGHFEFDPLENEKDADYIKPEFELLLEHRGDPVGFGMKSLTNVVGDPEMGYGFSVGDVSTYQLLPTKGDKDVIVNLFAAQWPSRHDGGYWYLRYRYDYNLVGRDGGFVRCIKKD
jgi:uncharacterized protein (TIGR02145 family)